MRVAAAGVGVVFLVLGCSSGSPKVEQGPRPSAAEVPATASGEEIEVKTSTAATLGIPPGHLPPPGQCRIWEPGKPPGLQSRPGRCSALQSRVPVGGWLVYRPTENRRQVRVWVYDDTQSVVSLVRIFDIATGRLLREETPEER